MRLPSPFLQTSLLPRLGFLTHKIRPRANAFFAQCVGSDDLSLPPTRSWSSQLLPVGRIKARYLPARLPNPPVRPVRETFASYGSRERDVYRKLLFRQLHGIHRGQLARSLATFVPFPHPLPKGLRHVRSFPALRLLCPI